MGYNILQFFLPFTSYPYQSAAVPCPACGQSNSKPIVSLVRRLKRLSTSMCGHCGLLYTNPMPTDAELSTYYQDYYRFDYQAATTEPKERHLRKRRAEASRRMAQVEGLLAPGARTLDFGCGSGELGGACWRRATIPMASSPVTPMAAMPDHSMASGSPWPVGRMDGSRRAGLFRST